ncbi:c-type cytochrome [Rhodoferax sp.]|uniref:c-type cytochrome n=1 Tax=Rhodoferax sp. TaxID=50421 RepID=UPI002778C569|nr:c-type cytochrome [Rhodoferax sp.]
MSAISNSQTAQPAALPRRCLTSLCLLGALLLGACEPRPAAVANAPQSRLEVSRPANANLSEKYERACMTCHIDAASGAPRTHDQAAWRNRPNPARDALITSVQQGRNAMPPMGLCPDCSREELGALIDFMRGAQP